jgi:hypothetical protein
LDHEHHEGSTCWDEKINDRFGPYFITNKGLRQGNSLFPLLFDLAADALAIAIDNAKRTGLVKGVLNEESEGGINRLQYADDTVFLLPDDLVSAKNLKFILCTFEQISGLKINFHKSELYLFGDGADKGDRYKRNFTCQIGNLSMKYLGLPVNKMRLRNKCWSSVESKIENRCAEWQGRLLNIAARLTLVQASLSNMSWYMMSFL